MATVDNRVVEMQFDNAAFERKISTTVQSLDKLQRSLDLANATKGLDNVSKASQRFSLAGVSSAVDGISAKFLALSTIGITVLSNIVNRATNAGISLAKSLSLDQVISGFREYELNMKSIQTILANTKADGTNLRDVNSALDQLNTYADKTIYNFGEMARNIGTFTAAGVDLDTSVQSIKGIANLAAISGSNSQQASTAMYQLSQAISTGTLRLMDWNSVVNAGMGGEVFQKALFETGKAMGTIADVDLDTTFEQWTSGGNSFRSSLEQNWLTADVLTTTLKGFTGELTEAQLLALGYTKEQAKEFLVLGETGVEAATKVRTLTQLIDTVKEAIGSGWSQSFRIVFGDFEEATEIFTRISDAIGGMVGASADARNDLLTRWDIQGGREATIEGLTNAFKALGSVINPIREAFRTIFPPMTAYRLAEISKSFQEFTEKLVLNDIQMEQVRRIFTGIFAAIEIGWTIVKEAAGAFKDLFDIFTQSIDGEGVLTFFVRLGDTLKDLNQRLVAGGGIAEFFDRAVAAIVRFTEDPIGGLEELKNKLIEVFNILFRGDFTGVSNLAEDSGVVDFLFKIREKLSELIDIPDVLEGAFARLQQRFESLKQVGQRLQDIWAPLGTGLGKVKEVFGEIWNYIKDWFSNLGSEMAKAAEPGDFDAVVDVVNVGLLGGIAAILAKFVSGGINFDFGGGLIEGITKSLEGLTGVLEAMQADIKANAILKIAGAVALLTASMVVLAGIDSEALTKALTAISVGFAQLLISFAIVNQMALGPKTAASFVTLAAGLTLLSGAMLLLAFAAKVFASMSWEELAKGLGSVTVLMGVMAGAVQIMAGNTGGMIRAGIGIGIIAGAMLLLGAAMKIFATMSWEEMAKGLTGVAGGLGAIVAAMNLLPKGMVKKGAGILFVGVALLTIAAAAKIFATMSWEEMGKGLAGVAGGLLGIALAMQVMPANLIVTAAGLALVSGSLLVIAEAMKRVADMEWEDLAKGLVGLGGALVILAGAALVMSGAIVGAIGISMVSASLILLAGALETVGKLSIFEIIKGLVGIAATLAVLAAASLIMAPISPLLILMGIGLVAVGAGFALFGVGAMAFGKGLEMIAKAGKAAIGLLLHLFDQIIKRIPTLAKALAVGLVAMGQTFLEAAPVLIEQLGVLFEQILITIADLAPEFAETVTVLITEFLGVLRDVTPDFIATGLELLLALLSGIRDNIGEIVSVVAAIIGNFLSAMATEMPTIVQPLADLIIATFTSVAEAVGKVAGSLMLGIGVAFLTGFWDGLSNTLTSVKKWVEDTIKKIINWFKSGFGIASPSKVMMEIGKNIIQGLLNGLKNAIVEVTRFFIELPGKILGWIGNVANTLYQKGKDLITGLRNGVYLIWSTLREWFGNLGSRITGAIGSFFTLLKDKGKDLVIGLKNGIINKWDEVKGWISGLGQWVKDAVGSLYETLKTAGKNLIIGLKNGVIAQWDDFYNWIKGKITGIVGDVLGWLGVASPSVHMIYAGEMLMSGLRLGIDRTINEPIAAIESGSDKLVTTMTDTLSQLAQELSNSSEFNPTITPVLDLTQVQNGSRQLNSLINSSSIVPNLSYAQANLIASTDVSRDEPSIDENTGPREIKFEQNNYSPESLSVADIYRQTRNQITMAKEELSIP